MPGDPKCPKCGGAGHMRLDGMTTKRCGCLLRKLFAAKMGYQIWGARIITKSKLVRHLEDNLLLIYDDVDINPHLKLAFIHLGLDAHWVYITDNNVLQAWLNQPNSAHAENLYDLVEPPFMVLRLGVLGYPNKALPGVICELLLGRALSGRVTWIVSPRELRPETCREYSDELMIHLNRYFKTYRSKSTKKVDLVLSKETTEEVAMGAEMEDSYTASTLPPSTNRNMNDMLRTQRKKTK